MVFAVQGRSKFDQLLQIWISNSKVDGLQTILTEAFLCFLRSLRENILTVYKTGYGQFVTYPLKLIISKSFL